jgi:hypothetical protein
MTSVGRLAIDRSVSRRVTGRARESLVSSPVWSSSSPGRHPRALGGIAPHLQQGPRRRGSATAFEDRGQEPRSRPPLTLRRAAGVGHNHRTAPRSWQPCGSDSDSRPAHRRALRMRQPRVWRGSVPRRRGPGVVAGGGGVHRAHFAGWLKAGAPRSDRWRGAPAFALRRGQRVRFAACSMTLVTAPGSAIIERWGASILVMWAPALWAIES